MGPRTPDGVSPPEAPDGVCEVEIPEGYVLERALSGQRVGSSNPGVRRDEGAFGRATRTPQGAACYRVQRAGDHLRLESWGPGTDWIVAHAPDLTGVDDDPLTFVPAGPPKLVELARRLPVHMNRTLAPFERLVTGVLQQLVTWPEAKRAYFGLLDRYGEDAPGPLGMRLQPSAALLRDLPWHALSDLGISRQHAERLRFIAREHKLVESVVERPSEAKAMLESIRGIGPWTSALVRADALGDPDAITVGDYHLPNTVSWALAREERGSDERMLELLEPYRPHRGRVVALIHAAGIGAPKRGPRREIRPRRRYRY